MDNEIIEYLKEQLPDIRESYDYAVETEDFEAHYLEGILQAYNHIIAKFGA